MPLYCVTGGTGFIAAHLVRALLFAGHTVRATVRDPEDEGKVGFLCELEGAAERLQLVRADLMVEGSFDEAVSGVDGVFHTASSVVVVGSDGKDVQEKLVDPIVKGAARGVHLLLLLRPLLPRRHAQRVALDRRRLLQVVQPVVRVCQDGGGEGGVAAGQEARHRPGGGELVIGPALGPRPTSTSLIVLAMLKGELGKYPNTTIGFVHVDDVVLCHVVAMEEARASGRLICSSDIAHWSEILESLRERYPQYPIPTEFSNQKGRFSNQKGDDRPHKMDTSKIKALGFPPFLSVQQMFDDCIKSFQNRGLLP